MMAAGKTVDKKVLGIGWSDGFTRMKEGEE